ncbi:hypothetical protein Taro_033335 [Colocasia esculenta]|uniref:Uncharacterized protein n=1 Tax=Colocasia esculenta TaxID=4460 RepID=A0A843W1C5_COLES|nr:hypothetical protein [Colocasia esculenta]
MASRGRRCGAPAHEGELRREEQTEQQASTPQGLVLPPPPPVDYGVFMQGLVQAMQTQAHTQAALQAQLEAQDKKKAAYQTPQRPVAASSTQEDTRWYGVLDGSGKMLEVREQRPQDQGLSETSAGSPARSTNPSSNSSSSANYRKTRKASSPSSSMDFDAILGLDWLEEHYALVDYRRKRIVFRIPGEDEFSHPLPRNLAGKLVISAMKAMRKLGPKSKLASTWMDVCVE